MEPTANLPPEADPPAVAPAGELVVQNGRLSGVRRPLGETVTVIGRAPGCEVCLALEGVHALHCVVVRGSAGFLVRDLTDAGATLLNGEPVTAAPLHHGDTIEVGPYQFRAELPDSPAGASPAGEPSAGTRDALRIQAAAVAAQQAGLTEAESRLQQQRKALKRHEEQLADHLQERQRRLKELQEQVRQERSAWKVERAAAEQEMEGQRKGLAQAREETVRDLERAGRERLRLVGLRKRLKQRWRRHWQEQEKALGRRAQEMAAAEGRLRQQAEALQREREGNAQAQLRFNGEVELGRRQLRDEWQQLGLAQQRWEEALNREQAERVQRNRALDLRAAELAAADLALAEQKRLWQQGLSHLKKEHEGIDARVRNLRHKLQELECQPARPGSPGPAPAVAALAPAPVAQAQPMPEWPEDLGTLAGLLADQRLHLLEQWQRLLEATEAWHAERVAVVADLELAGRQLANREQQVVEQEQALEQAREELVRRQEALAGVRCQLEGWQARLRSRETTWEGERATLLADVQAREEVAASQVRRLEELRQRWAGRRRKELEDLQAARAACEELRQHHTALWQECQKRRAKLAQEQREASAQMVSLERFRQELLTQAPDAAAAEKRILKLRKRDLARIESGERDLTRERQALQAEIAYLQERARHLERQEDELVRRYEAWSCRQTEWEDQQAASADAEERRHKELHRLQQLHAQDERQLVELRDELERVARLLLDEVEPSAPAANRAA
jgi:pSer/pThr/pTyr-binding forkhead associated (FHA) protein